MCSQTLLLLWEATKQLETRGGGSGGGGGGHGLSAAEIVARTKDLQRSLLEEEAAKAKSAQFAQVSSDCVGMLL